MNLTIDLILADGSKQWRSVEFEPNGQYTAKGVKGFPYDALTTLTQGLAAGLIRSAKLELSEG